MFDVMPNGGGVVLTKSVLPFSMSNPVWNSPTNFTFRLNGQTGASYTICASTDLVNWLPVQSNTLV